MTGAIALLLAGRLEGSAPPPDPLPNVSCPVQPYKPAVGRFSTQHQGRRVYFCCDMCRAAFERQPGRYAAALPALEGGGGAPTLRASVSALRDRYVIVLSALAALAAWSLVRRRKDPSDQGARPAHRWAVAIVVLQAALIADLLRHRPAATNVSSTDYLPRMLREKGEALANYAMMKQAIRLLAPEMTELERTYYRGNDERDPRLFNGGFYRTATFHIAVVAGEAGAVRVGDVLGETPLFVQLVIDRASGTAAGHFDEGALARYHFVRGRWRSGSDASPAGGDDAPGRSKTGLEAVTPGWQWRARYPLGPAPANSIVEGVLYLTHDTVAATSYGVHYRLVIAQSRLQKGSSLFMAAVYGADYPPEQWFSEKPIPEIVGSNTDDPVLLGLEPGAAVVGETPPPPRAGTK